MTLEPAPDIALWLGLEAREFDWDAGNIGKSQRKHGVPDAVIEAVLSHPYLFMGRVVGHGSSEPRYLVLGTGGVPGRGWALIFTIRREKIRPISCRRMRDKEWVLYEEAIPKA